MKNFALTILTGMLLMAVSFAAEELTVAEQQRLQNRELTVKARLADGHQLTTVTGLAVLPDGKPAVGF